MEKLIEVLHYIASSVCKCETDDGIALCQACTAAKDLEYVGKFLQEAVTKQLEWNG